MIMQTLSNFFLEFPVIFKYLLLKKCIDNFVFLGDDLYDMKQKLNVTGSQLSDWNQNQINFCARDSGEFFTITTVFFKCKLECLHLAVFVLFLMFMLMLFNSRCSSYFLL